MIVYRNHKPNTAKEDKQYVFTNHLGVVITDAAILEHIRKMAIPPAYTKVKIDLHQCAKIKFEGYDDKGRLQQKYSEQHNTKAKKAKFCRLIEFGKSFPKIQADIKQYATSTRVTQNKIIAIILQIIWRCGFRVGNVKYLHLYESHGISNIYRKHVTFHGKQSASIEFKGKKGVINKCVINAPDLVKVLFELCNGKGDTDFVFTYTKDKNIELIRPADINKWLGRYGQISSKDLRTFDVNVMFIDFMRGAADHIAAAKSVVKKKKIAKMALEQTAAHINNTPGICKSSYLMTELYAMFVDQPRRFKKYFLSPVNSRTAFVNFLTDYCI
jgi:DNA topoisomerase I